MPLQLEQPDRTGLRICYDRINIGNHRPIRAPDREPAARNFKSRFYKFPLQIDAKLGLAPVKAPVPVVPVLTLQVAEQRVVGIGYRAEARQEHEAWIQLHVKRG